jgi:hypothetical protein
VKAAYMQPLMIRTAWLDEHALVSDLNEARARLNDLLAILQKQEQRTEALEAGHLFDRALESPTAIAEILQRARELVGQD